VSRLPSPIPVAISISISRRRRAMTSRPRRDARTRRRAAPTDARPHARLDARRDANARLPRRALDGRRDDDATTTRRRARDAHVNATGGRAKHGAERVHVDVSGVSGGESDVEREHVDRNDGGERRERTGEARGGGGARERDAAERGGEQADGARGTGGGESGWVRDGVRRTKLDAHSPREHGAEREGGRGTIEHDHG